MSAERTAAQEPRRAARERQTKRAARGEPLKLKRTKVGWRRLGDGFVKNGIPITVRIGDGRKLRGGELKAKVVVRARPANRLKLWPNPKKLKDRSVAKRKVKVKPGQRRTIIAKPHKRYRDEFRKAGPRKLQNAEYQVRAVLRDREGRKVARRMKAVKIRNR